MTIIGIAGGTGSGKTTAVKKIVEALPPNYVAVVPQDSYYNDTSDLTDEQRKAINLLGNNQHFTTVPILLVSF